MEQQEGLLKLFTGDRILLLSQIEEHGPLYMEALRKLFEEGVVGCKTLKAGGSECKIFWMKQYNECMPEPKVPPIPSPCSITPNGLPSSGVPRGKRTHPKFVSPLLSSRHLSKRQRLSKPLTPPLSTLQHESTRPNPQTSAGTNEGNHQAVSELMKEKKLLEEKLKEKEDKLRKLKMVKLYRTKNDIGELDDLIHKWLQVSQEAAETLQASSSREPRPSMTQLLDYLHIDPKIIQYSEEDESFY